MAGKQTPAFLSRVALQVRADILRATTVAGSGHPTSCLSAVETTVALMFGGVFRANLAKPDAPTNDRLIFSKGHAAPLLYALYAVAGKLTVKQLITLRKFSSVLEGHPTRRFKYVDVPTGSLGQGLGIGVGMALAGRMDHLSYRTYVLLGDAELSEGSVWEAAQLAGHEHLGSLTAIVDANGLGQSGRVPFGKNVQSYAQRFRSLNWTVLIVDGHNIAQCIRAYKKAEQSKRPTAILARTLKGKGVSFLENAQGWHGKALSQEQCERAMRELSPPEKRVVARPLHPRTDKKWIVPSRKIRDAQEGMNGSLREACGAALVKLGVQLPDIVVLDGDVQNSTMTDRFAKVFPKRFVECSIAEQAMASTALGLASRGKIPVVATFAAFLTRAFDQFRMAQYAGTHQVIIGTHAGVSVGEDGPSQMGLEDVAMFRTLRGTTIYAPADATAAAAVLNLACAGKGMVYCRIPRPSLPDIYPKGASFKRGGSHTFFATVRDHVTLLAHGVTVHEAMRASVMLAKQGIRARVMDCYSIHPLDTTSLLRASRETRFLVTVEDHHSAGGFGEAVRGVLGQASGKVTSLAADAVPRSGTAKELLALEGIDAAAIVEAVSTLVH